MTTPGPASLWHFLSREVALACDASGTLTWADDRAVRLLELAPGQSLRALAAQGTEDKVDRLVTLARDERVELRFEEPPAELETDEAKVRQVLRNLVSNALKFTEKGHVSVSAERGPEDTVCFRVSDTGIGIAPEHHARIFEEFTQVDSPLQKQVKGTGLGLALSRRLAEFLGGSLTV